MRVWIPLAHSDAFQDVKVASKSGDLPLKQVHQPEYGNEVLYAETSKADKSEYKFSVDYDVVRKEHVVLVNGKALSDAPFAKAPGFELARRSRKRFVALTPKGPAVPSSPCVRKTTLSSQ